MKKLVIPIIVFTGISINAIAQVSSTNKLAGIVAIAEEKSAKELKGDKYYFVYSFDKAIDVYSKEKELSVKGQRNLAKSYFNMNQNIKSEETYFKIITEAIGVEPTDYYNYAMVLKADGKYDESNKQMDKFVELKPEDLRAKDYKANKAGFSNLVKDNGNYKIEHLNVNTDAEDFGTSYYKDKIVFASTRTTKLMPKESNRNGKPFLNMYVSEVDNKQLKTPENFDKSLNGKMNDGPASFNKEGTFMAFTENNYDLKRKELIVKLEIYFRTYADNKWSTPEPFILNNKEYSVGHPSLSSDGNTMYFSSDMPGGFGGTDIYRISKDEKGTWGKAENLGNKINTEGDELFPFFEEKNQAFFFSSNGRFGLGGLDIFICAINGTQIGGVVNAGSPLNTQSDDFSIIVDGNTNKGYFSSNRIGGSGDDDIYSVEIVKLNIGKKIIGIAMDKDGIVIPKTFITLRNDKGNVIDTTTTKADAAYAFLVETNQSFKLIGHKEKYIDGDSITNTFGEEFIVKADVILLTKEEIIERKIQVGSDLGEIFEFNTIYFDYHKYNIRPDAETELNKMVKILNEHPNLTVELTSHTDCRSSKEYNQKLSDRRAKASADYIKKRISNPERIYGKGYGETKLVNGCACEEKVVSECSEEEHQKNRRTEFIIVKK